MNLTREQERIAKSLAEGFCRWRDDLGPVAWSVLGAVLLAALLAAGVTLALLLRRRR